LTKVKIAESDAAGLGTQGRWSLRCTDLDTRWFFSWQERL